MEGRSCGALRVAVPTEGRDHTLSGRREWKCKSIAPSAHSSLGLYVLPFSSFLVEMWAGPLYSPHDSPNPNLSVPTMTKQGSRHLTDSISRIFLFRFSMVHWKCEITPRWDHGWELRSRPHRGWLNKSIHHIIAAWFTAVVVHQGVEFSTLKVFEKIFKRSKILKNSKK